MVIFEQKSVYIGLHNLHIKNSFSVSSLYDLDFRLATTFIAFDKGILYRICNNSILIYCNSLSYAIHITIKKL